MALSLEEVFARVPGWEREPVLDAVPLDGGITNRNIRVRVKSELFVVRVPGGNSQLLGINRETEYEAHRAASLLGIAPEVCCFLRPEGCLVTRYLEARKMDAESLRVGENIRRVAESLLVIHGMQAIPGEFSPFRTVESYADICRRQGVALPERFGWLMERTCEMEAAISVNEIRLKPCHNDLLCDNILDDGRIRIIDWEYAGMGDPFFDLANISVNNGFEDAEDSLLMACYFGEASRSAWARLKLMKIMSDFREAMWGMVQSGISDLSFDFRGYAGRHFDRMLHIVGTESYRRWLKEAEVHA